MEERERAEYQIKNDLLKVKIQDHGGSLCSVRDREGTEYLWQGNPAYWEEKAPNLFPYIGRLTRETYAFEGQTYHMGIHGFIKDSYLQVAEQGEDFIRLFLEDNDVTWELYPFHFRYEVAYRLLKNSIQIQYRVVNRDDKTMYFGIGGHPGFNVPLEPDKCFEDYYLQFPKDAGMNRVNITPACFVGEGAGTFPLEEGNILSLRHNLFDQDAIILQDIPEEVSLMARGGRKGVKVVFPQMKYLGLWHAPKTDAPYICIEPWSSLPSRQDVVEDLAAQPGLIALNPERIYENSWNIQILA